MTYPDKSHRCRACRFWVPLERGDLYPQEESLLVDEDGAGGERVVIGTCRRYPPALDGALVLRLGERRMAVTRHGNDDLANVHSRDASCWPLTEESDWCGEFWEIPGG
jgi:hypothetical protein